MPCSMSFADLAIPSPVHGSFTYSVPEGMALRPGARVAVEFRRRPAVGFVLSLRDSPPEAIDPSRIQPIVEKLDDEPSLSPTVLELVGWMSGYYCAPIGEVVRAALPARLTQPKAPRTTRPTRPHDAHPLESEAVVLNPEQRAALEEIHAQSLRCGHRTFLLHGITGSGKTEVYLSLIGRLAREGRQGLILVPEIGLAPQLAGRAAARFGERVAVYHSGLTDAQRHEQWTRARSGEVDVVIGTRSALFAPLPKLGAIVVDEEHSTSYKQDEGFTYNGRDSAIMRAHLEGVVCVLGSATPTLESYAGVRSGKFSMRELPNRTGGSRPPSIEVVDMRAVRGRTAGLSSLSPELHEAISRNLGRREQSLLYIGRRGFASAMHCEACGELVSCPNCDISLTMHTGGRADYLTCHYCDYTCASPEACPACGAAEMNPVGQGTQRLEGELRDFFPDAKIERLDSDMAASTKERRRILDGMRSGGIDILVGTQMITKGHDFPGVTLVGVVSADQALAIPDFRSAERTFQLITQVAGRAGRGEIHGRVLVQTWQPEHPGIAAATRGDAAGFVERELAFRERAGYPPFRRLAAVRLSSLKREDAKAAAARAGEILRAAAADGIEVLGPAPAGVERVRNRYRWQLLVKAASAAALAPFLAKVRSEIQAATPRAVRLSIDVDPANLL